MSRERCAAAWVRRAVIFEGRNPKNNVHIVHQIDFEVLFDRGNFSMPLRRAGDLLFSGILSRIRRRSHR